VSPEEGEFKSGYLQILSLHIGALLSSLAAVWVHQSKQCRDTGFWQVRGMQPAR